MSECYESKVVIPIDKVENIRFYIELFSFEN